MGVREGSGLYTEANLDEEGQEKLSQPPPRSGHVKTIIIAAIVCLLFGIAVYRGISSRTKASSALARETLEQAIRTVSVIPPKRGAPAEEIVLPGNIQAFIDAPIYARTNGYLRRWTVDIGAHVKAGQLLAEIDTPEVEQQLQQARADLATAEANLRLAEITASRYQELLKTDSISKQEADNASGDLQAKGAIVQSARYNMKRLEELQSFQRIYAPFDGVITARNTDIGALIDSGSASPARELFHIASTRKLRIYVKVPQVYARAARPGLPADLTLSEFPGRRFKGTLVRTAESIEAATRTLLVEIDLENPHGTLLPGAYAEVHLKLPSQAPTYLLPVNALLFRSEGLQIAVLEGRNRAVLIPVTIGRDFGTEVEIVSGLNGGESVILNPPDSLVSGEAVSLAPSSNTSGKGN
ncbi:MAG TPA: efflux RND transporter periplasmic adaptor subunit [Terriglobia bacterium]|nr:efflux RND transporter periplasmic adaptor subunit [Terriglobia bacterium]